MFADLGLLERAISYTLGSLHLVRDDLLGRHTPCRRWDLRTLLAHLNDSLAALQQALDAGSVPLRPSEQDGPDADPVRCARSRASGLLGACTSTDPPAAVWIAERPVSTRVVSGTGALELAVHGWDIAVACGTRRPIPPPLAEQVLRLCPMLVTDADRPERFAEPVAIERTGGPGDRLIAFLGRQP